MAKGALLQTHDNSLESINDNFRHIEEQLNQIMGINGDFAHGRWTMKDDRLFYTDTHGTIIHALGETK